MVTIIRANSDVDIGSAYKAAGLEKVFGAEKKAEASGTTPETAATTTSTTTPAAPAQGGLGVEESAPVPKS